MAFNHEDTMDTSTLVPKIVANSPRVLAIIIFLDKFFLTRIQDHGRRQAVSFFFSGQF